MTTTVADLLPRHPGAFEKAAALAATDTLPVPIRQVVDPVQTPAAFLPFLAQQESVDLWYDDWTEDRKRAMIGEAVSLAARKGARIGAIRYLSYVDATLVDAVAYPAPFVLGYAIIGRTPVGLPPFTANYLIKVVTTLEPKAFVIGRSAFAAAFLKRPSRQKFDRALAALRVAKSPETFIRADFGYMRQLRIEDAPPLDGTYRLGAYIERAATPALSRIFTGVSRVSFDEPDDSGGAALFEDI